MIRDNYTILKFNNRYAVKSTETNELLSDWMNEKDMRQYIIDEYRSIWFYLTDLMYR